MPVGSPRYSISRGVPTEGEAAWRRYQSALRERLRDRVRRCRCRRNNGDQSHVHDIDRGGRDVAHRAGTISVLVGEEVRSDVVVVGDIDEGPICVERQCPVARSRHESRSERVKVRVAVVVQHTCRGHRRQSDVLECSVGVVDALGGQFGGITSMTKVLVTERPPGSVAMTRMPIWPGVPRRRGDQWREPSREELRLTTPPGGRVPGTFGTAGLRWTVACPSVSDRGVGQEVRRGLVVGEDPRAANRTVNGEKKSSVEPTIAVVFEMPLNWVPITRNRRRIANARQSNRGNCRGVE